MAEIVYEFTQSGAKELAGSMQSIADTLKRVEAAGRKSSDELAKLTKSQSSLGQGIIKSASVLGNFSTALQAMSTATGQGNTELGKLVKSFASVASAAVSGATAFGPWGAVIGGATALITNWVDRTRDMEAAADLAADAIRRQTTDIEALQARMANQTEIERLTEGMGTVEEQTAALTEANERLDAEQTRLAGVTERLNAATEARTEIEGRLTGAMYGSTDDVRRLTREYDGMQARIQSLNSDVRGFTVAMQTQTNVVNDLARALEIAKGREDSTRRRDRRSGGGGTSEATRQRRQAEAEMARLDEQTDAREAEFHQRAMERVAEMSRELDSSGDIAGSVREAQSEARRQIDAFFGDIDRARAESHRQVMAQAQEELDAQGRAISMRGAAGAPSGGGDEQAQAIRRDLEDRQIAYEAFHQAIREMEASTTAWTADQLRQRSDFLQEQMQYDMDNIRAQQDAVAETSSQLLDETGSSLESIMSSLAKGFSSALKDIAKGTKSADQAFQAMLASFLEMLSEMATLEAIKNFAAAIADFAQEDYASGALHLAAGVAWTVVAVAAGAGAVAAAPAEAAPAAPQANTQQSGGEGGSLTVNINGTILTAGDRTATALLGRELEQVIGSGRQRFGRAA